MKYCSKCGFELLDEAVVCPKCGCAVSEFRSIVKEGQSNKNWLTTLLLCLLLGGIGVHRFYVGKTGTGILMLLTLGGFGIWALVDLIMIICESFKDSEGKRIMR